MVSFAIRKALICTALLAIVTVKGQQAQSQTTVGIQPLGSYSDNGVDQISLANLGLHVDIPLFEHKGRGSEMGTNVHLVYDSSYSVGLSPVTDVGWRVIPSTGTSGSVLVQQVSSEFVPLQCEPGVTKCNAGYTNFVYNFSFIDSTGYGHPFINGSSATSSRCQGVSPDGCTNVNLYVTGGTYDNSGYSIVVNPNNPSPVPNSVVVRGPSGNVFTWSPTGITTMADSNGNSGTGVPGTAYWVNWSQTLTDDTNVSATITGGAYSSSDCTQWTSRAPIQVQYKDTSGNPQTVTVNFSPPSNCSPAFVNSIVYPDGSSYHFTYQAAAGQSLASMQLPTGGTISYSTSSLIPTVNGGVGIPATVTRSTPDGVMTYNQTADPCSIGSGCGYTVTSTTNISKPDGSSENISFVYVPLWQSGVAVGDINPSYETAHTWTSASGTLLKSTMRCYNGATGDCTTTPIILPITQIATTTTIGTVTSKTIEFMNAVGLVTESDEYDFGASSPVRKTVTAYASLGNNIADRPSSVTVYNGSGSIAKQTTFGYDEYGISPLSLPGHSTVPGARGNQTSQHAWLNTTGGTLDSHHRYDDAGQVVAAIDPLSNSTAYGYDAATDTCLITVTPPTPLSGVSLSSSSTCDSNTGLTSSATDPNGTKTLYSYDSMLRLIGQSTTSAQGTLMASMARSYSGASLPETITTSIDATPSPTQVSTVILDGLGRTATTISPNGASTVTTFNSMGYVQSVSNPYITTSDPTYGITSYLYDGLGRKSYQCQADNSSSSATCVPTNSYQSWTYSGNSVTFTDEAGHSWQRTSDALGRLTNMVEPTGASTHYSYNALDDLTTVNQTGVSGETPRARIFVYDSLSRLTSATNPETGTISYNYDANGNVQTKTAPAQNSAPGSGQTVTTTYGYDALNRMTFKTYSDGNWPAHFGYDGFDESGVYRVPDATNPIGRLTRVFNGGDSYQGFGYDAVGRLIEQSDCLPSNCNEQANEVRASYDLAGNVTSLTYPDGRVVTQGMDAAGHLRDVIFDNWNGQHVGYTYASGFTYTPTGAQVEVTYGNGVYIHTPYNNRQQMCQVWSQIPSQPLIDTHIYYGGSTIYCNNTPGNNGNITQVKDWRNPNHTQYFGYDGLNRINAFSNGDGSMQQSYSYDSFGNLSQSGTINSVATFNAQNQISSGGYAYDAAGNLSSFNNGAFTASYWYNAENALINVNNGAAGYITSGDGKRIQKHVGSSWTEYVYFGGQMLAEKNSDGTWSDYIYANGQKIAQANGFDIRIHTHGTAPTTGTAAGWNIAGGGAYIIQSGDKLCWRQFQSNGNGGPDVVFTDGTQTVSNYLPDGTGQQINNMGTQGTWVQRVVDMSSFAGKTVSQIAVLVDVSTPAGDYDIYYGDMAFVSTNGSVTPIYDRQMGATFPNTYNSGGQTNLAAYEEKAVGTDAVSQTYYYVSDQLGSARMVTSGGGWPVSSSTFYPFGQEQNPTTDPNHYKFTGKERDTESGLDYFGARYYASSMGRWMSPDWSASPTAIPYASLQNPQSLNLYGYVNNNPLSRADVDGHFWRELWNAIVTGCDCWTRDRGTAELRANSNYMAETFRYGHPPGTPPGTHYRVTVGIVYPIGPLFGGAAAGAAGAGEAAEAAEGTNSSDAGNTDPSTPVGRRGNPMDVTPGTNDPQVIDGRQYTGHALDQMQGRGIPSSAVEDTITNGTPGPGNQPGTATHTNVGNGMQVVTNSSGDVVTVKTISSK